LRQTTDFDNNFVYSHYGRIYSSITYRSNAVSEAQFHMHTRTQPLLKYKTSLLICVFTIYNDLELLCFL